MTTRHPTMRPIRTIGSGLLGLTLAAAMSTSTAPVGAVPLEASPTAAAAKPCTYFPANNWWHADISKLPVDRRSAAWRKSIGTRGNLHPDFGPSYGDGPNYGIPITKVTSTAHRVKVTFEYADESDRVGYPLSAKTKIEGGPNSTGDRHAIVVDTERCKLYETYLTRHTSKGWKAGSGAVWNLRSNKLRPDGWTSADAAGLPILPGLLRYREVRDGHVNHAIRFTVPQTAAAHLWPARHDAGSGSASINPPMGARFRLKQSYSDPSLGKQAQTVIKAMKKYGLVVADNGSPWFFQGEQNSHWAPSLVEDLKQIPASAFEAVDTSSLQVSRNSAATG
jgi:hypothetical protein